MGVVLLKMGAFVALVGPLGDRIHAVRVFGSIRNLSCVILKTRPKVPTASRTIKKLKRACQSSRKRCSKESKLSRQVKIVAMSSNDFRKGSTATNTTSVVCVHTTGKPRPVKAKTQHPRKYRTRRVEHGQPQKHPRKRKLTWMLPVSLHMRKLVPASCRYVTMVNWVRKTRGGNP